MKGEYEVAFGSVEEHPYDYDGRKGVSYPVRVIFSGKTFKFKGNKDLFDEFRNTPQLTLVVIETEITSNAERLGVQVNSIRLVGSKKA